MHKFDMRIVFMALIINTLYTKCALVKLKRFSNSIVCLTLFTDAYFAIKSALRVRIYIKGVWLTDTIDDGGRMPRKVIL